MFVPPRPSPPPPPGMRHINNRTIDVDKSDSIPCAGLSGYKYKRYLQNMSTYKLTYFNLTGLAESIRYLLSQCGIKFEDVRITFEEWPKHKPSTLLLQSLSNCYLKKKKTEKRNEGNRCENMLQPLLNVLPALPPPSLINLTHSRSRATDSHGFMRRHADEPGTDPGDRR